ncbi:zinc knuckle [Paraphaeosphaeria sporulosa]
MESEANSASPTRRSGRARTKTPKAAELGSANAQDENNEIDIDPTTEIETDAPGAPRAKRTRSISGSTIGRKNGAGNGKDPTAKETLAAVLAAMEDLKLDNVELKAAVEELTTELSHVKAQLVETKAQAETLAGNLETQLSRMQVASEGSPTYADIARTPPSSQPSNLRAISGTTTPSAITGTIYCTIDTSRVETENKPEAQLSAVRQAIEKQIRETQGQETWRCAAVTGTQRTLIGSESDAGTKPNFEK